MTRFLIYVTVVVLLYMILYFVAYYIKYVTNNIDECSNYYDFDHFRTFYKYYKKYKEDPECYFRKMDDSIILEYYIGNGTYQCAMMIKYNLDTIMIENDIMILYPIDWLIFKLWKHIWKSKKRNQRIKGLWREEKIKSEENH